jgi:hypothetical protein
LAQLANSQAHGPNEAPEHSEGHCIKAGWKHAALQGKQAQT